jgi:hypothetical protein
MRNAIYILIAGGVVFAGVLAGSAWKRTNLRISELEQTCEDLRSQLEAREQMIADLRGERPVADPGIRGTNTATSVAATQAELQRRMAEVAALQSNAAALVQALVATREAPEAAEIPEHLERARVSMQVYEKHLQEAREKASALAAQTKNLLITLNIPREVAAGDPNKALSSVELQPYWPYFEAKRELEAQNIMLERLKMRMLQETVEAEILEAQKKAAK